MDQSPFYVPGFSDVDAANSSGLIAYLDLCTRISQAHKRASYAEQGITAGMCVLDAGCGTGDDVRAIAGIVGPIGCVIGVDSSRAMVAEARKRGLPSNTDVRCSSVADLAFEDATFDAARAERLFQHLEAPDAAARELRRVLKPGGRLMLVDQDWETIAIAGADETTTHRIIRAFFERLADGRAGRNHAARLRRAGFRDLRACPSATSLPLGPAYALVLKTAVDCATEDGILSATQADAWVASLAAANRRGEFSYTVTMFVTHARA